MIDHVSLGTNSYARAVAFDQRALAPLGLTLLRDTGSEASFGIPSHWSFFLYPVPVEERVTARGTHLAFGAASRAEVSAVPEAARAASAPDVVTARERPDISAT